MHTKTKTKIEIEQDSAIICMHELYRYKYLDIFTGPLKNLSKALPSLKASELVEHRTRPESSRRHGRRTGSPTPRLHPHPGIALDSKRCTKIQSSVAEAKVCIQATGPITPPTIISIAPAVFLSLVFP